MDLPKIVDPLTDDPETKTNKFLFCLPHQSRPCRVISEIIRKFDEKVLMYWYLLIAAMFYSSRR